MTKDFQPHAQPPRAAGEPACEGAQAEIEAFLGVFQRDEPKDVVRARIDAAIEQAIAPLSWPLRVVARPALRFTAQLPDWISIRHAQGVVSVGFSSGVELSAELGGASRPHSLPGGTKGDVKHLLREGQLHTVVTSDAGEISNVYEAAGDGALLGHAQLASHHLPRPIRYTMRLRRRPA